MNSKRFDLIIMTNFKTVAEIKLFKLVKIDNFYNKTEIHISTVVFLEWLSLYGLKRKALKRKG